MLRSLFIALSSSRTLRNFAERSRTGQRLASRFVAGSTVQQALAAAERVNQQGMAVSLDSLGESVNHAVEARAAAEVYHLLLDAIAARGLDANVSLKLTQMGLDVSEALAEELAGSVVERAARLGNFVRIDMESSAYTERTLQITERLHTRAPGHVGTVLQACLYRTEADAERLLQQGIRIRLCKGAYKEPASVAYPRKTDVDRSYTRLIERLLTSDVYCGLATHDEAIIQHALRFARQQGIASSAFEFQMLYGIRRDLQRRLVQQGAGVRVYIPFGTAWFPYLMRRLAERPANVFFLARNLVRH